MFNIVGLLEYTILKHIKDIFLTLKTQLPCIRSGFLLSMFLVFLRSHAKEGVKRTGNRNYHLIYRNWAHSWEEGKKIIN